MKKILLAPLDPVHDNAIKILKRKLTEAGYIALSMPPGTTPEEVIELALQEEPAAVLVSRTLGYKVAETLGRLVDLAEAAGLRKKTKLGIGGMAITREIGAELGFDGCFVGELNLNELTAFLEGRSHPRENFGQPSLQNKIKPDLAAGYTYAFKDRQIERLLDQITGQILRWAEGKTSPGIERAKVREEMLAKEAGLHASSGPARQALLERYLHFCDADIRSFYQNASLPSGVRWLDRQEIQRLPELLQAHANSFGQLRHITQKPLFFVQYGTGCPLMDVIHIKTAEAWGVDGVLHFDPSWGAQREGLLEGLLSHEHDGTIVTLENLQLIRQQMQPSTLWNVRGHRGLNTPELQVLGHAAGADLLKINIIYGSTGGGTDPERLTVDGIYSMRLAARYGLPFDIPGNDELSGVPPHKTFAGLLVMMALGLKLGAKPIPKPLLCASPYFAIQGDMDDNRIDVNLAKLGVWREILDTPIWPGEPVGFMTHSSDRVQSAVTTAAHAALAASAGVDAVTIASSDEAYSKGSISAAARVDSLRATRDLLRFMGSAGFQPTSRASLIQEKLHVDICTVLENVAARGDFVASIYEGLFGSQDDGLYPGRTGRGSVLDAN
jgi:methylmalonyl-CoA mutase cobalamin-binding subunit